MLSAADITLICPHNDLEADEIIKIAKAYDIDTRRSEQGWGARLGREPQANLGNLKKTVVVVEMPDPEAERRLRRDGHEIIVIDHHNYSDCSRWRPESGIEQFCALIGHEVTPRIRKVAANDREFIRGLFDLGCSYDDMEELRVEEQTIRGTRELFPEALKYYEANRKHFTDLELLASPSKYLPVMGEAAQWTSRDTYEEERKKGASGCLQLPNSLVVYQDDDGKVAQIEFYGQECYRKDFDALRSDARWSTFFEMWLGGGPSGCYWGAKAATYSAAEIDKLIDRVLNSVLIQGRPLRHFSTTFLFPFRFQNNVNPDFAIPECSFDEEYSLQEKIYFLPEVQRVFYKKDKDRRPLIPKWSLPLSEGCRELSVYLPPKDSRGQPKTISMGINKISMYRFFNGIHILSITVTRQTDSNIWDKQPLWCVLTGPAFPGPIADLTIEDALTVNYLARIVYPTYAGTSPEEWQKRVQWHRPHGSKRPLVGPFEPRRLGSGDLNKTLSPIIQAMIEEFMPVDKEIPIDVDAIADDRMFTHTCFALAGDKPEGETAAERYQALFSNMLYVDTFDSTMDTESGYCYDRNFTKRLVEEVTDRRWYGPYGNLYGFSRFSAVYMGTGEFFQNVVCQRHVDTMYLRMSLMALFYRASLLHYNHLMADMDYPNLPRDSHSIPACLEEANRTHWELTVFSNKYWHREVTTQDQGIELFNLQSKAMDLDSEYNLAKQKIDRIYDSLNARLQQETNMTGFWVAVGGVLFSLAFILGSYAGLANKPKLLDFANERLPGIIAVVTGLGLVVAVVLLVIIARRWILSQVRKDARRKSRGAG